MPGMCGDYNSVIGMDKAEPMRRFVTGMAKERFTPADGEATLSGLYVETDDRTGKATRVAMVRDGGSVAGRGPMTRALAGWLAILILLGAGWGATQPLAKIAVSRRLPPFRPDLLAVRRSARCCWAAFLRCARKRLPLGQAQLRLYRDHRADRDDAAELGLLRGGAPSACGRPVDHACPLVPMFVFPDRARAGHRPVRSASGCWACLLGLLGVSLLIVPEASLPDRAMAAFIPLALVAPFFYAVEGNIVAKWGTYGCDAIQVLLGASLVGAVLTAPLALGLGPVDRAACRADSPESR